MPIGTRLTDRYEVKQTLGQGGTGVVYWAYDTLIRRDVALKTIRDAPEPAALEMFYKECNILASISHPNIIEIFDIGKFEDEGAEKPYFVMPLLKGVTLDSLIRDSSRRLTAERTIEIMCQTCRGLQAAHEHGLVHRDLKPSNIFVLEDDSVKIIDFGVAHMADALTASAPKGTLLYMSPEQIQLKPATALSDIFTLGVVAYEALALRRPFDGPTYREIAHAILHHIPPPASELNPSVSSLLGRVVHKTMAKQPWNRFSSARELADAFQKALRNEPIEAFDATRTQPRIDRATKAFEAGDHQFASEILTELESEGHLLPEMGPLRRKIDQAISGHFPATAPASAEALSLQQEIESSRGTRQVEEWFRLARQHLDRFAFSHARQAVEDVLQQRSDDPQALELMAEIQQREQQYLQLREEKEKLYQSAVKAYEKADLSEALSKLERVLELDRKAPEISSSERGSSYQSFYNQVRSEQDANMSAYAEARRCLAEGNFNRAIEISEEALKKYPGQALFQALRFDIEERKRQKLSAYIVETDRNVSAEPDLDKRVDILRNALEQFPDEQHFERTLRLTREKRDLVNSIVAKARRLEEQAQFSEALGQWEILRTVYGQYPGLEFEIDRVTRRRDQQIRTEAKTHWTEQIDRQIESRNFKQAASLLKDAQREFPADAELDELAKLINQGEERKASTQALIDQGRAFCVHGRFEEASRLFRQAYNADETDVSVRSQLVDTLVQHARTVVEHNWKYAGELVQSALELDPANPQARSLSTLVADRKRDEVIDQCVSRARQSQASGDIAGALAILEEILVVYPTAARLLQLKTTLNRANPDAGRTMTRRMDLDKLTQLEARAGSATDPEEQRDILSSVRELAAKHLEDTAFQTALISVEKRYVGLSRGALPPTLVGAADLDAPTFDPPHASTEVPATPPPNPTGNLSVSPRPPLTREAAAQASAARNPVTSETRMPPGKPPITREAAPAATANPPVTAGTQAFPDKPPATQTAFGKPSESRPFPVGTSAPGSSSPETRDSPEHPGTAPKTLPFDDTPPMPKAPAAKPDLQAGPPPAFPPAEKPPAKWRSWLAFAAGFAAVAAVAIGAAVWLQHQPAKPSGPVAGAVAVDIRTEPEGAAILVNDKISGNSNLQLKLAPGTYRINAVRDGYRPSQTTLTVTANHSASANIVLQAMPATLRLLTDFASANITMDGHPQNSLQGGQLILDNVAAGSHLLTIGSGTSGAAIHFDAREGAPPLVTSLEAAKDTSAILITNLGSRARIYSSQKAGTVTFDGKPAGPVDPTGVELTNVGQGDHEITVGDANDHRKVVYETALVPALTVYLNNTAGQGNVGTLLITTSEDDVQVSLDGKPVRAGTRHGQLRIPNLPAKQYVVSVAKDGFQPVPEQRVNVAKGDEAKVAFQLKPVPAIAALHLAGGLPGTQVVLDGKPVGTVGQDGTMQAVQVPAGSHSVVLRRDDYRAKTFQLNFAGGKDVTLSGSDVALEGTFGTLVLAVTPSGAQVTIQKAGEGQAHPLSGTSVHLAEGSYTVTATAPHFNQQSTTVEIATGRTKNVTLQLTPEKVAVEKKAAPPRLGMSGWQSPAAWAPDGDHFTRKGGNLCLYTQQGPGTYSFTASVKRGKQLRWVAHVTDDRDYAEFEVDSEYFYRRLVTGGKSREILKKKHAVAMEDGLAATVQLTISPAGIVQRIHKPDGWVPLDSWMDPALREGRFGFLIRGRDEVNLSAFWFSGSE